MAALRNVDDLINQIPTSGYPQAPAPVPTNALQDALDTNTGRALTNTAAAVPGLGLVGGAARTANLARPAVAASAALPVTNTAMNTLRAGSAAPTLLGLAPVAAGSALAATNGDPASTSLRQPPAQPSAPAEPMGPPTSAMTPDAPSNAITTSADRVAQINRDIAHQQDLQKLRNPNDPTPGMTVIDGGADARQKFFDEANLRSAAARGSWSPRKGFQGDDDAVKAAAIPIQNRSRLSEMSLKNAGEQAIAQMRDVTDRRGQDLQAATAKGAQDVTARGQELTAKTAAAAARVDQMNKDRTFNLDVQKYGQDVAKANFDQRIKSREAVENQVKGFLPTGPDGKPDLNAHAAAMSSVNNAIAQRQAQLQAQLAKTPDRADVKAEIAALEKDPYGALGQDYIRKLTVGLDLTNTARQTATGRFNPVGTSYSGSSAPVTSLRKDPGLFGTDYVATHADRSTSTIPARNLRDPYGNISPDYNLLLKQ